MCRKVGDPPERIALAVGQSPALVDPSSLTGRDGSRFRALSRHRDDEREQLARLDNGDRHAEGEARVPDYRHAHLVIRR